MSSSSHTPGPWLNDGGVISARPDPENSQAYIAPICVMDDGWYAPIGLANARLVAAAPELLQTLCQMLGAAEADCLDDKSNVWRSLMLNARAVIDKVEAV